MRVTDKLQALVSDILPSTTAVFSYAIGSRKLSANEQFFVGAQTVVSLLQTTQIKQGVPFIAANKVYTSTNKTTIAWIETELFLWPGVDASHVYVRALALGCFYSHISTRTFRRALTASLDSCAEIKSAPFSGVTKSGRVSVEEGAGKRCSECGMTQQSVRVTVACRAVSHCCCLPSPLGTVDMHAFIRPLSPARDTALHCSISDPRPWFSQPFRARNCRPVIIMMMSIMMMFLLCNSIFRTQFLVC